MFGGSNASDYKIVMAKHHAGSSAVLSSGPAVQLRPHNFVVTCIASQKKFALIIQLVIFYYYLKATKIMDHQ